MDKVKRIIQKIKDGYSISQIAREESINRYGVSIAKQTMELYESQIKQLTTKIEELKSENSELKNKLQTIQKKLKQLQIENEKFQKEKNNNLLLGISIGILITLLTILAIQIIGG